MNTSLAITGSEGAVGRRLLSAFSDARRIDLRLGHDLRDICQCMHLLSGVRMLIHLAADPNIGSPWKSHSDSVRIALNVFEAAAECGVTHIVLASSTWADPIDGRPMTAYGRSKLAIEEMLRFFAASPGRSGAIVRIGALKPDNESGASEWLRGLYWSDDLLRDTFVSMCSRRFVDRTFPSEHANQ